MSSLKRFKSSLGSTKRWDSLSKSARGKSTTISPLKLIKVIRLSRPCATTCKHKCPNSTTHSSKAFHNGRIWRKVLRSRSPKSSQSFKKGLPRRSTCVRLRRPRCLEPWPTSEPSSRIKFLGREMSVSGQKRAWSTCSSKHVTSSIRSSMKFDYPCQYTKEYQLWIC